MAQADSANTTKETGSAPADLMLTAKGERYAIEHSGADPLIIGARRLPRKALRRLRKEAEAEVARLIDIIDRIDGDADLEPSLSSLEAERQLRWAHGGRDDLEEDACDLEDGRDAEPSLCGQAVIIGRSMVDGSALWPQQIQAVNSGVDQTHWSGGSDQDLEAEFDGREEGHDREEDEAELGLADSGALLLFYQDGGKRDRHATKR